MTQANLAAEAQKIRQLSLAMIYFAQSGHPGGCLSVSEVIAVLWHSRLPYGDPLRKESQRNRMVLSKGHSVPAVYAAAFESGLVTWDEVKSFRNIGSRLQGHPHVQDLDWLETSTGSLGQGISVAAGLALGEKMLGQNGRIYCVCGDGELQEGQVWEAAAFSAHHGLGNLTVIVDRNRLQSDMGTEEVLALDPLDGKWRAFGWRVLSVDGHDVSAIEQALDSIEKDGQGPTVLIAETLKGHGVSWMENDPNWHGSVAMTSNQVETALLELGADRTFIEATTIGADQ